MNLKNKRLEATVVNLKKKRLEASLTVASNGSCLLPPESRLHCVSSRSSLNDPNLLLFSPLSSFPHSPKSSNTLHTPIQSLHFDFRTHPIHQKHTYKSTKHTNPIHINTQTNQKRKKKIQSEKRKLKK